MPYNLVELDLSTYVIAQSCNLSYKCLFRAMMMFTKYSYGMAIELDDTGDVYQTYQDPAGLMMYCLSQVTVLSDHRLALGSYTSDYIALVDAPNI